MEHGVANLTLVPASLKPNLAPERVRLSVAETVILSLADDVFKDEAVALNMQHATGRLIDEPLHTAMYRGFLAAVLQHLNVEG
jgi:hypothetical protein